MKFIHLQLVWYALIILNVTRVPIYARNQGMSPYLALKNVIADHDTLLTEALANRLELRWDCKQVRFEFTVRPQEVPDLILVYQVRGNLTFGGKTRARFLELPGLTPGLRFQLEVQLAQANGAPPGNQISALNLMVEVAPPPAPVLKLDRLRIDGESVTPLSYLELRAGSHTLQFGFSATPIRGTPPALIYQVHGPQTNLAGRIVLDSLITCNVRMPGEYVLETRLETSGAAPNMHTIYFRIKAGWWQEHRRVLVVAAIFSYFLINLLLAYWVMRDANKTRRDARYWVIFTFFMGIPGYLVYKIYSSPALIRCPACQELIAPEYQYCPFCQTQLQDRCPQCKLAVQTWMHYCPACGTELKPAAKKPDENK